VPIETLHFLIIAIQKTGSMSYMCILLLFLPLCGFNYQLMPKLHSAEVRASTKNSAQCYQTDFSSDFSGWAQDYLQDDFIPGCLSGTPKILCGRSLPLYIQTTVHQTILRIQGTFAKRVYCLIQVRSNWCPIHCGPTEEQHQNTPNGFGLRWQ